MITLKAHNRPWQARRLYVFFLVLAVIVLAAVFAFSGTISNVFTLIVHPFWQAEFSLQSGIPSFEGLLNENEKLKREIDSYNVRLATIRATEDENRELKSLMGRASTTPRVLAAVLMRPPLSPYDEIIIDAGREQGLSTTSRVYASYNVPIGQIIEVQKRTAKAILFSSPGQKVSVEMGSSHLPATAIGQGGGQYVAELPRGTNISKGDFVIMPSLYDKPLGIVVAVLSDPADSFEKILFAPPINIYQLRWVMADVAE